MEALIALYLARSDALHIDDMLMGGVVELLGRM